MLYYNAIKMIDWPSVSHYLFKERRLNVSQEKNYEGRYNKIYTFFEDKPFTHKNILLFLYSLEGKYSPSTIHLFIVLLKHICKKMGVEFVKDYKAPRRKKVYKNVLSAKEIRMVVDLAYTLNYRYAVAVEMALRYGYRVGTLCTLRWEDVFDDYIVIRNQKDGIDKHKVLEPDMKNKLMQLRRWKRGYVFEAPNGLMDDKGLNKFFADVRGRLNINKKMTFHDLRHTCATNLHDNGVDIRFIQEQLDHKDITTTEVYTHVSLDGLRKVLKKHELSVNTLTNEDVSTELKERKDRFERAGYYVNYAETGERILLEVKKRQFMS